MASGSDVRRRAAVIIPARNCARTIGRTIREVDAQIVSSGADCEVVVVDDASTDATAEVVDAAAECMSAVRCVRRPQRGGPNAARNSGVLATGADDLVFLDGDDCPAAGWLVAMLAAVTDDDVIAGGSYVVEREGRAAVVTDPAGMRLFGFPYALGGAMAFRRSLFERVGGFDENIMRGGTEVEFAIQAQARHGAHVTPVPEARVHYRYPGGMLGRFRLAFARERGRAYIERRILADGIVAPKRERPDQPAAPAVSRRAARRARARRSGGWRPFLATRLGERAGRRYFRRRDRIVPARRGVAEAAQ